MVCRGLEVSGILGAGIRQGYACNLFGNWVDREGVGFGETTNTHQGGGDGNAGGFGELEEFGAGTVVRCHDDHRVVEFAAGLQSVEDAILAVEWLAGVRPDWTLRHSVELLDELEALGRIPSLAAIPA